MDSAEPVTVNRAYKIRSWWIFFMLMQQNLAACKYY